MDDPDQVGGVPVRSRRRPRLRPGKPLPRPGRETEPATDADTDADGAGPGAAHGANLIRVIHFARIHVQFFADEEVAGLLRASWRSR